MIVWLGQDGPCSMAYRASESMFVTDISLKSGEFKHWLRDVKSKVHLQTLTHNPAIVYTITDIKYLDEMSGESARKYFRRFVRVSPPPL